MEWKENVRVDQILVGRPPLLRVVYVVKMMYRFVTESQSLISLPGQKKTLKISLLKY